MFSSFTSTIIPIGTNLACSRYLISQCSMPTVITSRHINVQFIPENNQNVCAAVTV